MKIHTENDVEFLINEAIDESLHLEYKRCDALKKKDREKNEISKDVSAFANSAGGSIVYGVIEDGHKPIKIDTGFDPKEITKEWLEAIIESNISPKIDGIEIVPIKLKKHNPGKLLFAVNIPQSIRAPHQAADKKYYKRSNFTASPMEDYEVRDILNRKVIYRPLVSIDTFIHDSVIVYLSIKNIGSEVATNVKFYPDKDLIFRGNKSEDEIPILARGLKFFPPGKEFVFFYGTFPEIINGNKKPESFTIKVTYNRINDPTMIYSDEFHIDVRDYLWSTSKRSLIEDEAKKIREGINKLTDEVSKKLNHLSLLEDLISPTGLQLSYTTLRNLQHAFNKEPFEKIDARYVSDNAFMEILGVDAETAYQIEHWIRWDYKSDPQEKHGLSREVLELLEKYFILPPRDETGK